MGIRPVRLHEEVAARNIIEVKRLIASGVDVNHHNSLGWTPLHLAARKNYDAIAETLINAGADPDCRNNHQATPMHLAAEQGYREAVMVLIKHEADPNATDRDWLTPLHIAAERNNLEISSDLLDAGADMIHVRSAYFIAWDEGHDELASLLREHIPPQENYFSRMAEAAKNLDLFPTH